MNWKRFLVAVFAALLLLPSISMAQSIVTGAITGTVTDPSGAVIVGATATLTSAATGAALTAETTCNRCIFVRACKAGQLFADRSALWF